MSEMNSKCLDLQLKALSAVAAESIQGDEKLAAYAAQVCELMSLMIANAPPHERELRGETTDVTDAIDVFFLFVCAVLVFGMQLGFAMLCAGSVRGKNTMNILLKNVVDGCFSAVTFYLIGYGFAYGTPDGGGKGNPFIGNGAFALSHEDRDADWINWFFQWAFAAATATIVSGSIAERCTFEAYIGYSVLLSALVYPVVAHWVWSDDGWLSVFVDSPLLGIGVADFAGCSAVHFVGGLSGLIGAYFIEPRKKRFLSDGTPSPEFRGHSATLVVLGSFILWLGWYGFNCGAMLSITNNSYVVGRVAVTTTLAAGSAGVAATIWTHHLHGIYDLIAVCNGFLAGLVSITSSAAAVEPWAAVIIGASGAIIFERFEWLILNKLKIDDPLSASAMHGGCGAFGLLIVGIFAKPEFLLQQVGRTKADFAEAGQSSSIYKGLVYGGDMRLFATHLIALIVVAAWVGTFMASYFYGMKRLNLLRVSPDFEEVGLDKSKHGGYAYEDMIFRTKGFAPRETKRTESVQAPSNSRVAPEPAKVSKMTGSVDAGDPDRVVAFGE